MTRRSFLTMLFGSYLTADFILEKPPKPLERIPDSRPNKRK